MDRPVIRRPLDTDHMLIPGDGVLIFPAHLNSHRPKDTSHTSWLNLLTCTRQVSFSLSVTAVFIQNSHGGVWPLIGGEGGQVTSVHALFLPL